MLSPRLPLSLCLSPFLTEKDFQAKLGQDLLDSPTPPGPAHPAGPAHPPGPAPPDHARPRPTLQGPPRSARPRPPNPAPAPRAPPPGYFLVLPTAAGPSTDLEATSRRSLQPAAPGFPAPHSHTAWGAGAPLERLWGTAERGLGVLPLPANLAPTVRPGSHQAAAGAPAHLPLPQHP